MPASDVMLPGDAASKSPLDKPLHQLTEDDISQLTREDCRRYLKEKGMRRPSWNKSQAIQQVISLKALLEPSSDSDVGGSKLLRISPPDTANNNKAARVPQVVVPDAEASESTEEAVWNRKKDTEKPNVSGDPAAPPAAAVNMSTPSRISGSADIMVGQMTIFYCGKVNVYDDVPADKVQAIMHLAGSPPHVPPDCSAQRLVSQLHPANVEVGQDSPAVFLPPMQTGKKKVRTPVCKWKITVHFMKIIMLKGQEVGKHPYRDTLRRERTGRFRNKRKSVMPSSPRLDIYVKPQMQHHTANEHPDNKEWIMEGRLR
ncbi:unnamed protein product [Cuscuta europaea]|uniref:Protein TIFY n=1 Tax=Cuscuta europaea TaxID=41803 RepID=A0A9P0ZC62_CUSEU|nr:unnamed protein product [Cuscuta europaea]